MAVYTEPQAWYWLKRWPWLHRLSRGRVEAGLPPPPKLAGWPLEHLVCVKCDLDKAFWRVPAELQPVTAWHWRDDIPFWEIQRFFKRPPSESTLRRQAREGAEAMVAYLMRAGT